MEESGQDKVDTVFKGLKKDILYWNFKHDAQQQILSRPTEDVDNILNEWLYKSKSSSYIKNAIYKLSKKADNDNNNNINNKPVPILPILEEPLDMIYNARQQWDARLRYELRSISTKQKRKLIRTRNYDEPIHEYVIRFVYTNEDLLDATKAIINPNASTSFSRIHGFGLLNLNIKTPTLIELRMRYQSLWPDVRQVGVDDVVYGQDWFQTERLQTGSLLIDEGYIPPMRKYAQTGIPASLRPIIYSKIMNINVDTKCYMYYDNLISHIHQYDIVTDDLTRFDVQDCTDHDEFFIFEDTLDEIMLAFSRDKQIPNLCQININLAILKSNQKNQNNNDNDNDDISIPPNCVVPFHGQTKLCAPIAYLYQKHEDIYFLFRAMYCRYWHKLHVMSSKPDTIMYLSVMFESLLQSCRSDVYYHAIQLGVQPLTIAFQWMFYAFVGVLSIEQVLFLWDRIIGYDSLELLPILSVAIFTYRADSVLQAISAEELRESFVALNNIQVLPLLQVFLHSAKTDF